jgi:hypothetical protein
MLQQVALQVNVHGKTAAKGACRTRAEGESRMKKSLAWIGAAMIVKGMIDSTLRHLDHEVCACRRRLLPQHS